jgi:hypothetical protein
MKPKEIKNSPLTSAQNTSCQPDQRLETLIPVECFSEKDAAEPDSTDKNVVTSLTFSVILTCPLSIPCYSGYPSRIHCFPYFNFRASAHTLTKGPGPF